MQDEIIREVEATRERIAKRYGYDVRKIAEYLRERAAKRRTSKMDRKPASHTREGSAYLGMDQTGSLGESERDR